MQSILASDTQDYRWDPTKDNGTNKKGDALPRGGYVPASEVEKGPVFRLRSLNFWEAQVIFDEEIPVLERIRKCLETALVSVDGSPEKAAEFLKNPKPRRVQPLFDIVVETTSGN